MTTARYEVDELSIEVPEGFVDESMNVFIPVTKSMPNASVIVTREPRTAGSLGQQVTEVLKTAKAHMPGLRVLGHRDREVGSVPTVEVRAHAVAKNKQPTYQRHIYVSWYGTLLSFIVTTSRSQSRECDAVIEKIAASLKLKRKA